MQACAACLPPAGRISLPRPAPPHGWNWMRSCAKMGKNWSSTEPGNQNSEIFFTPRFSAGTIPTTTRACSTAGGARTASTRRRRWRTSASRPMWLATASCRCMRGGGANLGRVWGGVVQESGGLGRAMRPACARLTLQAAEAGGLGAVRWHCWWGWHECWPGVQAGHAALRAAGTQCPLILLCSPCGARQLSCLSPPPPPPPRPTPHPPPHPHRRAPPPLLRRCWHQTWRRRCSC